MEDLAMEWQLRKVTAVYPCLPSMLTKGMEMKGRFMKRFAVAVALAVPLLAATSFANA